MKILNRPRLVLLLAGIVLILVGYAIIASAYQILGDGSITSTIPSPGYEGGFLSYAEIGIIGALITGLGILLVLVSFGVRRWRRYQPQEFYINGVRTVGISVASSDYEKDKSTIERVMQSAELLFHAGNEFSIGELEHRMGWNFFILHVTPNLIQRTADSMETPKTPRGPKVEDRFLEWLASKLEEKECNVYLDLESRKASSKYGLF